MILYIGDYFEYISDSIDDFKYYVFTLRFQMYGDMYKMDDELSVLLMEAHRNVGFLKGIFKYIPNKDIFVELILSKISLTITV